MTDQKTKVPPAKKRRTPVPVTAVNALTPFAVQVLLDSKVTLDKCGVVVETIRGVKINLYSFGTDKVVEDLIDRLRDLVESFKGRRGRMKVTYVTLASLSAAEQMEAVVTVLVTALNSKEFRKAKAKEQREARAELSNLNREVLSSTEYSQFRPLRNKGTAKEYRPRDRNAFDQPKQTGRKRMFRPLEPPPEQQLLLGSKEYSTARPKLDPYKETDIVVPSDLSAWQLRLLIKTLS